MKRKYLVIGLVILLLYFSPIVVLRHWGTSVYPKEKPLASDLVRLDNRVIIGADVHGDVIVGGDTVRNESRVTGDFLAVGDYVHHTGKIQGSGRIIGRRIILEGTTERNLSLLGLKVELSSESAVKGNLSIAGSDLDIDGKIGGKLIVRGDNVTVRGEIAKDTVIYANTLKILPSAKFSGPVTYYGRNPAHIYNGAEFKTPPVYKPALSEQVQARQRFLFAVIGLPLLAVFFVGLFPRYAETTAQQLSNRLTHKFFLGLLLISLVPLFLSMLLLFKLTGLAALAMLSAYLGICSLLFQFGAVLCGTALGRWILPICAKRLHLPGMSRNARILVETVVGTLLLTVAGQIPYLGIFLRICLSLTCLGAISSHLVANGRSKREDNLPHTIEPQPEVGIQLTLFPDNQSGATAYYRIANNK